MTQPILTIVCRSKNMSLKFKYLLKIKKHVTLVLNNIFQTLGMKPEAVLTDDQRKVRFRNAIKKKASRETQNISREYIYEDEEEDIDQDVFPDNESSDTVWIHNPNLIQVHLH